MHEPALREHEMTEAEGGTCPVPAWALRPLAFALPALGVFAVVWFIFLRG